MDAAVGYVLAAGRRIDGPLLAAGLVLHLVADVVRNGGWHGALRAAGPGLRSVRLRDVQAAAFAGGGANALVPARGGEILKVVLIRRRAPAAPAPTVAATLVAESLLESAAGALLLAWALWQGLVPVDTLTGAIARASGRPLLAAAVGLAAAGVVAVLCALLRRRARRIVRDLRTGLAVLRCPRAVLRVVGPQLAGRLVRLAAIACCLSACGLPAGVAAAAVTMAVDGGTRVSFAPATAGLRVGLLSYGLPAATGAAVSVGSTVAYVAVMRATRTVLSVAIAAGVLLAMVGGRSPRRALDAVRRLRRAAAEPLQVDPGALPAEAVRRAGSL
jgi:hypothetical protein